MKCIKCDQKHIIYTLKTFKIITFQALGLRCDFVCLLLMQVKTVPSITSVKKISGARTRRLGTLATPKFIEGTAPNSCYKNAKFQQFKECTSYYSISIFLCSPSYDLHSLVKARKYFQQLLHGMKSFRYKMCFFVAQLAILGNYSYA